MRYIVECDGDTLLARYLGMYRITVHEKETYMVVMNSIRPVGIPTHRLYDLKGSKVDRKASDKERAKDLPCLKDIDFEEAQERLYLGGDTETFKETLKRDVQFLEKHNLMDYSLLVAIHDCNEQVALCERVCVFVRHAAFLYPHSSSPCPAVCCSATTRNMQTPGEIDRDVDVYHVGPHAKDLKADPKRLYFIGIIDVLTVYSTRKRAAHAAKTAKHGARAEISTVKPDQYAKRLLEFVSSMLA
ncbi:hypothetical protein PTSG_00008 [Salpingoeca rosetta]|uniref:PIPK domain-containing protein n=1 Tax=Salpingoeca rosetta (strain ATCC 50818 / BSB-021) TaxID=946362 RepID=F2TV96_SALR5|nr:uncharacterized protein PTSG_00008 [Salpingoeca rosetta]EGD71992.1 hypothetical protein PTSG_00008 [Salpingoeca rosetta]|eukprot:XP_004998564.1 hypothetical protein PTSG_00008 [Salpingoeca rosetta]